MQSADNYLSNGHTKTPMAEATELSLLEKLPEEGETAKSLNSVSVTAEELLQTLFSESWLESPAFKQFIQKIQEFTKTSAKPAAGISILLLDTENLKLDINTETFLARLCKYPLHVKIAFANWRNPTLGKQDAELYERGYQLVHVPGGKDSADAKMIAIGSSILRQYRTVKEVFVCSCDGILTHLCNQLQNQGVTVYWVRRQNHILKVENRNNGQVTHYSLAMETEIPSSEEFIQKIEELIKAERESITSRLSKLTTLATLFQERSKLIVNENRSNVLSMKTQEDEITPVIEEESTQSITKKEDGSSNASATTMFTPSGIIIDSQDVFEKVIVRIINEMTSEVPQAYVAVVNLATELNKVCGKSANSIVTKLKLGSNFTKFLESCPTFKLQKAGKQCNVAIAQR